MTKGNGSRAMEQNTLSQNNRIESYEPPDADPHVRWCGEGELKTPPYPMYARHGRKLMGLKSPARSPAIRFLFIRNTIAKALDEINCGSARNGGEEDGVQRCEPTNRNRIQG